MRKIEKTPLNTLIKAPLRLEEEIQPKKVRERLYDQSDKRQTLRRLRKENTGSLRGKKKRGNEEEERGGHRETNLGK